MYAYSMLDMPDSIHVYRTSRVVILQVFHCSERTTCNMAHHKTEGNK